MAELILATDGGCHHQQDASLRSAAWGFMYEWTSPTTGKKVVKEGSGYFGRNTAQAAELEALRQALLLVEHSGHTISWVSDSEYALGVICRGHKARKNVLLIEAILKIVKDKQINLIGVYKPDTDPNVARCHELVQHCITMHE